MNYNASQVGVPYVRASKITISWPDNGGTPSAIVDQTLAVKLADNSVRELEAIKTLTIELDFVNHGADSIPLVDPNTGNPLGANTDLNHVMLHVLAAIRAQQIVMNT